MGASAACLLTGILNPGGAGGRPPAGGRCQVHHERRLGQLASALEARVRVQWRPGPFHFRLKWAEGRVAGCAVGRCGTGLGSGWAGRGRGGAGGRGQGEAGRGGVKLAGPRWRSAGFFEPQVAHPPPHVAYAHELHLVAILRVRPSPFSNPTHPVPLI